MSDEARKPHAVTAWTLVRYLCGRRDAILAIAECPHALWVGAAFVFSAALARDYDGDDLARRPWVLLLSFGASLVASLLLFTLAALMAKRHQADAEGLPAGYRRFLALFWMMAPMASIYAIPVERMLPTAVGSTRANLCLLGIVAAWRVALAIRVIQVLWTAPVLQAAVVVLALADALALAVVFTAPLPVLSVMGGVRLTAVEGILLASAWRVGFAAIVGAPVLLVALVGAFAKRLPRWQVAIDTTARRPVGLTLVALAAVSVLAWLAALPSTQAEQRLRRDVEAHFESGRVREAVLLMSAHAASDFPPMWDPPPRLGYDDSWESVVDAMDAVVSTPAPPWVRAHVGRDVEQLLSDGFLSSWWMNLPDEEAERFAGLLMNFPEARDEVTALGHVSYEGMSARKRSAAERIAAWRASGR